MVLPSLALILGASASASPHAQVGTAREMKMVMGYELPLVLAFIVVVIKSGGQLSLAAISENAHCLSISGMIAFLVSILCVQAKLGFVPFDIAEAETELGSGVLMEYSGPLLGIWKLMQASMLVALPLFLVTIFMGGFDTGWWKPLLLSIGKYILIVVLLVLIKNTNPRVRIDQAMKFFWFYCGIVLAAAVVLAVVGNAVGIGWL
jgi:NADH-quinone oxidoreductase subunit H